MLSNCDEVGISQNTYANSIAFPLRNIYKQGKMELSCGISRILNI